MKEQKREAIQQEVGGGREVQEEEEEKNNGQFEPLGLWRAPHCPLSRYILCTLSSIRGPSLLSIPSAAAPICLVFTFW